MPLIVEWEQPDPQRPLADFAEDKFRVLSSKSDGRGSGESLRRK